MLQELTVTEAKSNTLENGVEFILKDCILVADLQHGFIVANDRDSDDFIYVESYLQPKCPEFGVISVQGKLQAHGNILKIDNVVKITYNETVCPVYPKVRRTLPDSSTDSIYDNNPVYCKVTGRLAQVNGNYILDLCSPGTLNTGASRRKVFLEDLFSSRPYIVGGDSIEILMGRFVEVEGFWNGVTCLDGQEYVNIIPRQIGELYMYDTPSGFSRTSNREMIVLNSVVAAKAANAGKPSVIVLWDPVKWDWVILEFNPSDPKAKVLADCKVGDRFDLLYGFVKEGERSSFPRHIVYMGYYEGHNSGTYQSTYIRGPFVNSTDFSKRLGVTYFEAIGTVNPRSSQLILADGYVMSDYCPVQSSILFGETKRTMSVCGYHLYDADVSYCIFEKAEVVDYNDAVSIQGILSAAPGAKVRTYPALVTGVTKLGFTIWEESPAPRGIYVDLSGMPADQVPDLMPEVNSRVEVSGVSRVLTLHTSSISASKYGTCIGGDDVRVIRFKHYKDFSSFPKEESLSSLSGVYDYHRIGIAGKLIKEGQYYQLELNSPNQYIRFFQPLDEAVPILEKHLGMLVHVSGYMLGYFGDMTEASPRYWYWVLYSVDPIYDNTLSMEDGHGAKPLTKATIQVNRRGLVPVYYLEPGSLGALTIPAGTRKISLYAVSNCKVSLVVGTSVIRLSGGFVGNNIAVDGSDYHSAPMIRKENGQLVSGPLDKDTVFQISLKDSENKDSETFVYIFGII